MPWYAIVLIVYFAVDLTLVVIYWTEHKVIEIIGPTVLFTLISHGLAIWAIVALASHHA